MEAVIFPVPVYTISLLALLASSSFSDFLGTSLSGKKEKRPHENCYQEEKLYEVTGHERANRNSLSMVWNFQVLIPFNYSSYLKVTEIDRKIGLVGKL